MSAKGNEVAVATLGNAAEVSDVVDLADGEVVTDWTPDADVLAQVMSADTDTREAYIAAAIAANRAKVGEALDAARQAGNAGAYAYHVAKGMIGKADGCLWETQVAFGDAYGVHKSTVGLWKRLEAATFAAQIEAGSAEFRLLANDASLTNGADIGKALNDAKTPAAKRKAIAKVVKAKGYTLDRETDTYRKVATPNKPKGTANGSSGTETPADKANAALETYLKALKALPLDVPLWETQVAALGKALSTAKAGVQSAKDAASGANTPGTSTK
jgi:hypothetical protein